MMRTMEAHVVVPIRTYGPNGSHGHWTITAARRKASRWATAVHLLALGLMPSERPRPPVLVTLTRVSPRRMDSDNAAFACKGVRDAVAEWLGIDDGSDAIEWRYSTRTGEFAVDITITGATP